MADPGIVADCIRAMRSACDVPVSVKTRIGIDAFDSYDFLRRFVEECSAAGCTSFVVHARKAILQGLSPKENRSVPPLNYARVYQLKIDYPELHIVLNGGVETLAACHDHLQHVDGVMIGRQAYHQPWLLTELERAFGVGNVPTNRVEFVTGLFPYIENELNEGTQLKHITRHMLGLFAGQSGARAWRRHLSEHAYRPDAGTEVGGSCAEQAAKCGIVAELWIPYSVLVGSWSSKLIRDER